MRQTVLTSRVWGFQAQDAQRASTPFSALPVTLPGSGISVTGVKLSTLPANAISYYEAEGVSVIFEVPMGTGSRAPLVFLYLPCDVRADARYGVARPHLVHRIRLLGAHDSVGEEPPWKTSVSARGL